MPAAQVFSAIHDGGWNPTRVAGVLAPATVMGNNDTNLVRWAIPGGVTKITVLADVSSVVGDPQLTLHPMSAPATNDDADGAARHGFGEPTAVTLVNGVQKIEYTVIGERYLEIQIAADANDSLVVDFVDIFGK